MPYPSAVRSLAVSRHAALQRSCRSGLVLTVILLTVVANPLSGFAAPPEAAANDSASEPATPGPTSAELAKQWIERGERHLFEVKEPVSRAVGAAMLVVPAYAVGDTVKGRELIGMADGYLLFANEPEAIHVRMQLLASRAAAGETEEVIDALRGDHGFPYPSYVLLAQTAGASLLCGDREGWKKLVDRAWAEREDISETDIDNRLWGYTLVDALGEGGDFERAEQRLKELDNMPHYQAIAAAKLASFAAEQGRKEHAARYVAMARKIVSTAKLDEATRRQMEQWEGVAMIDPREYAWAWISIAFSELGRTDEALEAMERLKHVDQPPMWMAMMAVGAAMRADGNTEGATALFEKIAKMIPEGANAEYTNNYAYLFYFYIATGRGIDVDLRKLLNDMERAETRMWACYGAAAGCAENHRRASREASRDSRADEKADDTTGSTEPE